MYGSQNAVVRLHLTEFLDRNLYRFSSSLIQFHCAVQRQKEGQRIGKSRSQPHRAADSGTVAELHADNMAHTLPHRTAEVLLQSFVRFKLSQRCHRTDDELLAGLLNLIQSQSAQINRRGDRSAAHLHPSHAA